MNTTCLVSTAAESEIKTARRVLRTSDKSGGKKSGGKSGGGGGGYDYNGLYDGRAFMVHHDDYDGSFQLVNSVFVTSPFSYYPPGYTSSVSIGRTSTCTTTLCSPLHGAIYAASEEVPRGDLLIFEFGVDSFDIIGITCPDIFQIPQVELLGCQTGYLDPNFGLGNGDDCNPVAVADSGHCSSDTILCLNGVAVERDVETDGGSHSGNTLTFRFPSPDEDFATYRFAVLCPPVDFPFRETTFYNEA